MQQGRRGGICDCETCIFNSIGLGPSDLTSKVIWMQFHHNNNNSTTAMFKFEFEFEFEMGLHNSTIKAMKGREEGK